MVVFSFSSMVSGLNYFNFTLTLKDHKTHAFSTCDQQNVHGMSQTCCWHGVDQCVDKHKNEKVLKVTFVLGQSSVTSCITYKLYTSLYYHIWFRICVGCSRIYGKYKVITPCSLGRWWFTLPVKPSFTTCHSMWCHNLEHNMEYLHCCGNLKSLEWYIAYKL